MTAQPAVILYLLEGKHVGQIAFELSIDRSTVRRILKEGGIILRPKMTGYLLGRDSVCDAVKRAGFSSFHAFSQVRSLDPITEQATSLGVSDKSLARVYNAYRRLLSGLKSAGIVLPTSQLTGVEIEQRARDDRSP